MRKSLQGLKDRHFVRHTVVRQTGMISESEFLSRVLNAVVSLLIPLGVPSIKSGNNKDFDSEHLRQQYLYD